MLFINVTASEYGVGVGWRVVFIREGVEFGLPV